VWAAASLVPVAADAVTASVLQAAMPCMITAGLVGIAAGFSERLIVAMLSLSTALSVLTLGVLFWVLG
jgi:predicted permease